MANNLKELRQKAGLTQERAAEAMNTTRNQYIKLENGTRRLTQEWIGRAATAFGVDPGALVSEANYFVMVVGRIGAGAEILPEFEQVGPEGLFEAETKVPIEEGALAYEVEGDSMWPRYDPGDIVICGRQGTDIDEVIGWEAAVLTADGRRFLKRVAQGSRRGMFNLESHNAPTIRDVEIEWVSQVAHVIRRGQWKALDEAARAKLLKRTLGKKKTHAA